MSKIFYLGPEGTFSAIVARRFSSGFDFDFCPVSSIDEVFLKLCVEPGSYGVIPIENTIAGVVGVHQDLLVGYVKEHNVSIVSEVDCHVRFGLLTTHHDLSQIQIIYAHPHSIDQCQLFKLKHMPEAQIKFSKSTIDAVNYFIEHTTIEHRAAIIPLHAIDKDPKLQSFFYDQYANGIQDAVNNITRFFLISNQERNTKLNFTKQKTSIFIESLKNEPALLFNILSPLANLKINMTFLHSRSSLTTPWLYNFYIDFYNKKESPEDSKLILDIYDRQDFINVTVLGTYDSLMNDHLK